MKGESAGFQWFSRAACILAVANGNFECSVHDLMYSAAKGN